MYPLCSLNLYPSLRHLGSLFLAWLVDLIYDTYSLRCFCGQEKEVEKLKKVKAEANVAQVSSHNYYRQHINGAENAA